MTWDAIQQFIRICLQFLAGYLVSRGILDEANATTLTGALLSIASVGWWFWWEKRRAAAT